MEASNAANSIKTPLRMGDTKITLEDDGIRVFPIAEATLILSPESGDADDYEPELGDEYRVQKTFQLSPDGDSIKEARTIAGVSALVYDGTSHRVLFARATGQPCTLDYRHRASILPPHICDFESCKEAKVEPSDWYVNMASLPEFGRNPGGGQPVGQAGKIARNPSPDGNVDMVPNEAPNERRTPSAESENAYNSMVDIPMNLGQFKSFGDKTADILQPRKSNVSAVPQRRWESGLGEGRDIRATQTTDDIDIYGVSSSDEFSSTATPLRIAPPRPFILHELAMFNASRSSSSNDPASHAPSDLATTAPQPVRLHYPQPKTAGRRIPQPKPAQTKTTAHTPLAEYKARRAAASLLHAFKEATQTAGQEPIVGCEESDAGGAKKRQLNMRQREKAREAAAAVAAALAAAVAEVTSNRGSSSLSTPSDNPTESGGGRVSSAETVLEVVSPKQLVPRSDKTPDTALCCAGESINEARARLGLQPRKGKEQNVATDPNNSQAHSTTAAKDTVTPRPRVFSCDSVPELALCRAGESVAEARARLGFPPIKRN